jgi:hypothetical protein
LIKVRPAAVAIPKYLVLLVMFHEQAINSNILAIHDQSGRAGIAVSAHPFAVIGAPRSTRDQRSCRCCGQPRQHPPGRSHPAARWELWHGWPCFRPLLLQAAQKNYSASRSASVLRIGFGLENRSHSPRSRDRAQGVADHLHIEPGVDILFICPQYHRIKMGCALPSLPHIGVEVS